MEGWDIESRERVTGWHHMAFMRAYSRDERGVRLEVDVSVRCYVLTTRLL